MNKLLTYEGGQPFRLDDIDFLQDAFSSVITALVSVHGDIILSGCAISKVSEGNQYTVTWNAGYITIKGGVYRVEAGSITVATSDRLYWKVVKTESENVDFNDGSQKKIYQYTKVVLTTIVSDDDIYIDADKIERYSDIIVSLGQISLKDEVTLSNVSSGIANLSIDIIKLKSVVEAAKFTVSFSTKGTELLDGFICNYICSFFTDSFSKAGIAVAQQYRAESFYIMVINRSSIFLYNLDGSRVTSLPSCTLYCNI